MRVPNLKHSNILLQITHKLFINKSNEGFNRLIQASKAATSKKRMLNALFLAIQHITIRSQSGHTRNVYQIIKNGFMKSLKDRKEQPIRELAKENAFAAIMQRVVSAKKRDCFALLKWEAQANRYLNISIKQRQIEDSYQQANKQYLIEQISKITRSYNLQQKLKPAFSRIILESLAYKPKPVIASKTSSKINNPSKIS